jgi:hypothetical protein
VRVLVACEFSGVLRESFSVLGHDAWSCDLLPTEIPGNHYTGDVKDVLDDNWDLMIAHPPCTHLAVSGAAWFKDKEELQEEALDFFLLLINARIPQIAIENPVGVISSRIRKPSQIVQPYWFGDREKKTTCLWLKSLPYLTSTDRVTPELVAYPNGKKYPRWHDHYRSKGKSRGHERSRTFPGFARAMAEQWGSAQDYSWRSRNKYREPLNWTKNIKE